MYQGKVIGAILPRSHFRTFSLPDSVQTIWLPDTQGGVVKPDVFVCNPIHEVMYVMGREQQNISICDRQTGERVGGILTNNGTNAMAYSETSDKLYCASFASNTIEVIDGATNATIKTIQIQDCPNDLVWNDLTDEVYCSHESFPYVSVIDCITDSLIVNIPVVGSSIIWGMLFNPLSNKIYCPCHCAPFIDSVFIIDGNSHVVTAAVSIGGQARFSTINTIRNKVYFASQFGNTVTIIDGNSDSLIVDLPIGSEPYCITYNSVMDRVYIGHRSGCALYILDGSIDTIIDILSGQEVWSMAFDSLDNRLFCSLGWENIAVIDCNTNSIIDSLATEFFTEGMYWDPGYNRIWVGNAWYNDYPTYTIYGFAADSLQQLFKTATGFTPYKACLHRSTNKLFSIGTKDIYLAILDMDDPTSCVLKKVGSIPFDVVENTINDKIYCANRGADTITVLDAVTDSIIAQIPSWQEPVRLALNQTDNKIYCANLTGNSVTVVDGVTNHVLDTIPVGTRPVSILWNSIDNKIYVGNSTDGTITIINASADTVITTVPSGYHQWALCHDNINDKIYSANWNTNNVTVIDGVTNQVIKSFVIGRPHCFAHNPSGNRMYCGSWSSGTVCVIDCETDSIIKTITVGDGPFSLLYNPETNTLFCAYIYTGGYPWKDALAVIDCDTDSIITQLIFDTQRWSYGLGDPKDALVLDSLTNTVYYTHYTSSKISVIDGATGTNEVQTKLSISGNLKVYPNPFAKQLSINYLSPTNGSILKIYDITGRLVNEFTSLPKKGFIWDGNDNENKRLPNGVYFIHLTTEDCVLSQKVLLIRY